MKNPYDGLPEIAFWKTAVAQKSLFDIGPVWKPKFFIQPTETVVTFGSCFAQHIGRALAGRGYAWTSFEQPPKGLSEANAKRFNYNVFSARTGNIYTTSLLHQWTRWAIGGETSPAISWEKNGRFYDPFRPAIEPDGFASEEEMLRSRQATIKALADSISQATYFVFTLGLTESWKNKAEGYEYAICPGTVAGVFDDAQHLFDNQFYEAILAELSAAIDLMLKVNPGLKFILTVSPVPLTATNSGNHVMVATMESKSTLRAVAGRLARERAEIDYFPSYEIVSSPTSKGTFFEPNLRSVNPHGVDFVMDNFFDCMRRQHGEPVASEASAAGRPAPAPATEKQAAKDDVVCEEELLAAFGK